MRLRISDLAAAHRQLLQLEQEIKDRRAYVAANVDAEGRVRGDMGPVIWVCVEDDERLTRELRKWWQQLRAADPSLPARSPAISALESAVYLGRAYKIHVVAAGRPRHRRKPLHARVLAGLRTLRRDPEDACR